MVSLYKAPSYMVTDRQFKVVDFMQTHCQLLLQSPPPSNGSSPLRIEVLFAGVTFMFLPPVFRGLYLRKAEYAEAQRILAGLNFGADRRGDVYLLSSDHDWFVVSVSSPQWVEAVRAYSDPSIFFPETWEVDSTLSIGSLD
ncbi:hypothetical protein [Micromonospora sp. NPDC048830]|uniref:hypothetical protein n=1 Tax=Micromonospora sp. NPDC048830 TaxID=3364257 RepID=UPI00371D61CD